MIYRGLLLVIFTVVIGLLPACADPSVGPTTFPQAIAPATDTATRTYLNITPDQLIKASSKHIFLVNTQLPYEGEIPSTNAFIPFDETEQRLNEYPVDKTAQIVVYSRDGSMSAVAAEALVKAGYTSVWNLEGGTLAWEAAGYALIIK